MLGHESILTTEIYTHIDRSFLRDTLLMFHPRAWKWCNSIHFRISIFNINFATNFEKIIITYFKNHNSMSIVKRVYSFGKKTAEGKAEMKTSLEAKALTLQRCACWNFLFLPFTITTDACNEYYENNCTLPLTLCRKCGLQWRRQKKQWTWNTAILRTRFSFLPFRRPQVDARNDGHSS